MNWHTFAETAGPTLLYLMIAILMVVIVVLLLAKWPLAAYAFIAAVVISLVSGVVAARRAA